MQKLAQSIRKLFSKYGSILMITAFAVIPAVVLGMSNYFISLHKNYESHHRRIAFATDSVDTEVANFVANVQELNDVLVRLSLVQEATDNLTSYIRSATDVSTIPMDPALFGVEDWECCATYQ